MEFSKKTPEVRKLIMLLSSEKAGTIARAALQLYGIGPGAVIPLLESLPSGEVPGAGSPKETIIISILTKMGAKALPQLIRAMDSDNSQTRELAAIVLGEIGEPEALEALYRAKRGTTEGSIECMLLSEAISKIEGPSEPPSYLEMEEAQLAESCAQKEEPSHNPMYF
jgi:HEAT repeat protein